MVNGTADADGSDFINVNMHVLYAEGTNVGNSQPQNSNQDIPAPAVLLGTSNPDRIKSGVPKNGASLYTGSAGIPTPTNKSTLLAAIPPLSGSFTTADLEISRELDTALGECLNQGHFKECPTYKVTIPATTFSPGAPLTTTYRIDASSLKMSASKILNSVLITYTGGSFTDEPVHACTNGTVTGTGLPCVLSKQCYKNNAQPASLAGDCEWILINTENGLTKFL
jgi:hypothetical protein